MIKPFTLLPILLLITTLPCLAQEEAPVGKKPPFLIIQTGIGLHWFGNTYKSSSLTVEKPLNRHWQLGLQGSLYFPGAYFDETFLGGNELGAFAQYFLPGRSSGKKSGLYLGPEICLGIRKFQVEVFGDFFPQPPFLIRYQHHTTKMLLRSGYQWQLGHAALELAIPWGIEFFKVYTEGAESAKTSKFVMLPSLQMGVAF